jgi:hypothetical protein
VTALAVWKCDNETGPGSAANTTEALTTKDDLMEAGALMADPKPTCSVDGCTRPAIGKREWCGMHTERWRRWGDPTEKHSRVQAECAVSACERPHEAQGWCAMHYRRWRKHGDPMRRPRPPRAKRPELDRLIAKLDMSDGTDACWPWTGYRTPRGYGLTSIQPDGKRGTRSAHRAIYQAINGDIPTGMVVRHVCDNPPCCNPDHLRIGTQADNMADRQERGAGYGRGNDSPTAVQLNDETVAAIRDEYRPSVKGRGQHALAQRFGLSRTTVQRIVTKSNRWAEPA